MGLPFAAGGRVLASDLATATQQGVWTPYVPTWTSTGTAPAKGNGTLAGEYAKVGRLVTVRISLDTGSTTTYGTGNYIFSLPLAASTTGVGSGGFTSSGTWTMFNAGNSLFYTATAVIQAGTPSSVVGLVSGSGNFMGQANPATFSGTGTHFECTITYESTS